MMINTQRTRSIFFVLIGLSTFLTLSGQDRIAVDVSKPQLDVIGSPEVEVGNDKSWRPKEWLEMEVEFEVDKVKPSDAKFVDELSVRWYVAVKNEDGKTFLIEKTVDHVNIPVKEKIYSSAYISPSGMLRLTGKDRSYVNEVSAVGGEIIFRGQVVDRFTSMGSISKPWWVSPSLSKFNKVPLRDKSETPFANLWWDRYAEIKVEN